MDSRAAFSTRTMHDQALDGPLVRRSSSAQQPPRAAGQPSRRRPRSGRRRAVGRDSAPLGSSSLGRRGRLAVAGGRARRDRRVMRRTSSASAVGGEQLAVGRHGGQQLAVVADVGDRAVLEQRDPVGQQHGRGPVGDDQAGGRRTAPGAAPPRPASRCARRGRTGCRRGPGRSAGPARRGPARAAGAGRRTATCPARRCGCRAPTAGRGRSRPGRCRAPARCRRRWRRRGRG